MSSVLERTERLVAVDTAPGQSSAPLLALLADELALLGARVELQEGRHQGVQQQNLVARFGGPDPAGLILAGHVDTVPWDGNQRATTTPERDGRTLFGRGTADMKGAVAAQVEAAAATLDGLRRPLVLAYTYAEEVGCHGALELVAHPALVGERDGAVCLVGEPTGCVPIVEHKGYAVAHIRLTGVPCHSSDPWAGADTSVALGQLLVGLHALRERLLASADADSAHSPPCTTLNTGLVRSGAATNVVPDRADVSLEWRPMPGADAGALRSEVQRCLDQALEAAPGVTGELVWPEALPAFRQDVDVRLVQWLVSRTGHEVGIVPFYTEAELYRGRLGVPTVVCGPGSIANAHRVDESITFDELESGFELYRAAVREFCG
jgi:acetylornithine deacetylase